MTRWDSSSYMKRGSPTLDDSAITSVHKKVDKPAMRHFRIGNPLEALDWRVREFANAGVFSERERQISHPGLVKVW